MYLVHDKHEPLVVGVLKALATAVDLGYFPVVFNSPAERYATLILAKRSNSCFLVENLTVDSV